MEPIFQPASYDPKLFLDEEGSLLTLEVQNTYETIHGEFVLSGPNPDSDRQLCVYEGQTFRCAATSRKKPTCFRNWQEMHFQMRTPRMWFMEPEEAIAFLLDYYPKLVEN